MSETNRRYYTITPHCLPFTEKEVQKLGNNNKIYNIQQIKHRCVNGK